MEDFLFIYGRIDSHDSCPSFLGSLTDFIGLHQSFLIVRTACAAVTRPLYGESYGYHGSTNRELTETFESDPHHARTGNCEPVSLCGQYVFIYIGLQLLSAYVFGVALLLLIASLGVSFREIQISTRSLEIYLGTMEKGKNKDRK